MPSRRVTRAGRTPHGSARRQRACDVGQRPGASAAAFEDELRRALDGACAAARNRRRARSDSRRRS